MFEYDMATQGSQATSTFANTWHIKRMYQPGLLADLLA